MADLAATTGQFVESLINGKRNVLCLNIEDPSFKAEEVVLEKLKHLKGVGRVEFHAEPAPKLLQESLELSAGRVLVVAFEDLDKHPKCIELVHAFVKKGDTGGKLVVVSRLWNADNTEREREIRKGSLFFQQAFAKKAK